jgi:hypothetical protein
VETENPSVYAMVNCKVCKSVIALYLSMIKGICPSGLRCVLSLLAWNPGSWVRIPLRAWMLVFVYVRFSVFVNR